MNTKLSIAVLTVLGGVLPIAALFFKETRSPLLVPTILCMAFGGIVLVFNAAFREKHRNDKSPVLSRVAVILIIGLVAGWTLYVMLRIWSR